ncbi:MAG TPA: CvpA family protein [Stellaceae bacterium]|nr:CvpA family protein [Stellaceae bacterium]
MNWLDLGVIGIVVLSAVFAFARGFVREALSIVAWVGAAAITLYAFTWTDAQVEPHVHDRLLSQLITGFGLFIASIVVLTIITGFIARMVHASGLSPIDRTLGFIFGVARGLFVVCLAYLLLDLSLPQANDRPAWIRDAKSGPYLHEGADMLKGFLPESIKAKTSEAAGELLNKADPNATAAEQAKRAMRALTTPTPPAASKPDSTPASPSYPSGDRRQLDRVIGTQR